MTCRVERRSEEILFIMTCALQVITSWAAFFSAALAFRSSAAFSIASFI